MKKFDELLKELNDLKLTDTGEWDESLPEDIWENEFKDKHTQVAQGLDVDTHRWYETSITVLAIKDRFLGIRHITNLFSESTEAEDCGVTLYFFEMEKVQITSYKAK